MADMNAETVNNAVEWTKDVGVRQTVAVLVGRGFPPLAAVSNHSLK
jgi:hypothetical protein